MAITVEEILTPDINRPARYLGNELGAVHKPWEEAEVRWVLTYPEIYEVGASNLGHIILYNILNYQPRQLCDRAYLPAPDLAAKLRSTQTPLFAVENRRPLKDFDIIGFSLSYELGATNILEMLDLGGIPLTWKDRAQFDISEIPLIFAGGQTATSNPEPYADFLDFVDLGDGEELLPEIGLVIEEGKAAGLSREALLLDLAQIPGVYVPQFYDMTEDGSVKPNRPDVPKRILRRVATPMPAYAIGLVPYIQTVHDRLKIEVRRGCTRGCRFCQPGMLTRPARDVEPEKVVEAIEQGMRATGYNEFSLLSLSCSDYLALPAVGMEIKNRLKDQNISLSLPSQRVDRFDENIANILGGNRQSGLTFAPEAGTQRMRDIVNKGLTNEELLRGVKTAFEQGWEKVKLYFMIGLPGETDMDVLGIAETVRWLQQECRAKGRKTIKFNITVSNFTPKPHTPFQWHSVSTSEFERKQELLKQVFGQIRGVKVNYTDVRISAMEDFVGRGDRRLSAVVRRAWELGAGMDSWMESLDRAFAAWENAIASSGLTWKYRQVENGEWNVMAGVEELQVGRLFAKRGQKAKVESSEQPANLQPANLQPTNRQPTNRQPTNLQPANLQPTNLQPTNLQPSNLQPSNLQPSNLQPSNLQPANLQPANLQPSTLNALDAPLPWDHIDTGIDKNWLKEDLQRALDAATVPDCSFDGCSHCGVCGIDFGHNVVIEPPQIPQFAGHFKPNTNKDQRLRVCFGKLGDMTLLGHLDLASLFERAVRRASLPIRYSGGFRANARIMIANALPLGASSSGEIVEFELTEKMPVEEFRERLVSQLPKEIPVYGVEAVDLKEPAGTQLLERAEYLIRVEVISEASWEEWQGWIEAIKGSKEIWWERFTKSGKKQWVNLCDRLFDFEVIEPQKSKDGEEEVAESGVVLRYVGSCLNDGTMLRPEHIIYMLEQVAQREFRLLHVHRQRLILRN
ncbi:MULTISPECIES: TIGR03960 family B12-binding radical SAM protein [Moorena]|uniref:Fe-S oxidoreductase n=1 Tax=Moorena producens 3L TaxID=489825 RepID=F4Y3B8_9CYAN|nr:MULTISPECIES: TIGR03960 family B12-binding radical SAM protein [Moorena]EGJ28594.1 Fe-S oxidoreductase [Moorena producens 3L]NEP67345.1 TIGR03960 family B12-binding radical SAM protein [Moorena sp. SIO3A5]NER86468.1 TIGR03960 family B12-binding radical SAM protein [Moorena sp. SIO3A2]NES43999.1 TIGR03960 family B12-binding radical SAM protein [Moorena sp. SIO2C4]OLT63698.1 B12-binding domain-containing radical SAM protein [Moorena producens 3L]